MKCRNCGTEIADNALICYRCGEPTAAPRIQPPRVKRPRARGPIPVITAMLVIILSAVVGLPYLSPGPARTAGWVVLVVIVFLTVWRLKPGSPRRKRQP